MRVCVSHFSAVLVLVLVLLACYSAGEEQRLEGEEEATTGGSWDETGIVPMEGGASLEGSFDNPDTGTGGQKLLEELRSKFTIPCWHQAHTSLLSSCTDFFSDPDMVMRLAYNFTDCYLLDSGRPLLELCPDTVPVKECTMHLNEHDGQVLAKFFVDIMSMCGHIQSLLSKFETEDKVSSLIETSKSYKTKLEAMQNRAKVMEENMERMAGSYQQLVHNVTQMRDSLVRRTEQLLDNNQQQSTDLEVYHETADLMDEEQSVELAKIQNLKAGMDEAMQQGFEELRRDARENRQEFEAFQLKMKDSNQRLLDRSLNLLKAQEHAHSKASLIITMIDRLQSLNPLILSYLGIMKALVFYIPASILIHLVTGTHHAADARAPIYIGMVATFAVEFGIIGTEQFALYVRGVFSALALAYTFYCILTYRDIANILLDMQKQLEADEVVLDSLCEPYDKALKPAPARRSSRKKSFRAR